MPNLKFEAWTPSFPLDGTKIFPHINEVKGWQKNRFDRAEDIFTFPPWAHDLCWKTAQTFTTFCSQMQRESNIDSVLPWSGAADEHGHRCTWACRSSGNEKNATERSSSLCDLRKCVHQPISFLYSSFLMSLNLAPVMPVSTLWQICTHV